jgi:hypothetical protein
MTHCDGGVAEKGSKEFFSEELLPTLTNLAQDPVANVRLALCRLRC